MRKVRRIMSYAVLASALFMLFGCGIPEAGHDTLMQAHDKMQKRMIDLGERIKILKVERQTLQNRINSLEKEVNRLMDENKALQAQKSTPSQEQAQD